MTKVEGKYGISGTVITDSISAAGIRMLTFELMYPRIIHSEFMTHGALAKNAASSRAIPFNKMKEQLTGRPVRFGQANPGMQDKGEDHKTTVYAGEYENGDERYISPEQAWGEAKEAALFWSEAFFKAGYHKQVYNRITEPFQMMKTVTSGTEWSNFFWLRDDGAADPTIAELARVMREAKDASTPILLRAGDWHLPYLGAICQFEDGIRESMYADVDEEGNLTELYTLEDAIKISAARCAAVSFRNIDYDLAKCLEVHDRLVGDERKHSSAMEHQATPMSEPYALEKTIDGVVWQVPLLSAFPHNRYDVGTTHIDGRGFCWSGRMRGFIQYRKLIPGENKSEY
jgi:hypothetical protein